MLSKSQHDAVISISQKAVSLTKDCYFQIPVPTLVCNINLLLTECEGCKYGLLTKCEVKMAGYWPSSFLRVYGLRRS